MTVTPPAPPEQERPSPSDIYKVSVEEYRFQAQFNWSRTQYFLAFNAAILAAAVAVARGTPGALVFCLGAVAAVLSAAAIRTQRTYYSAARDRIQQIEVALAIPADQRIMTTATLGGRRKPFATVTRVTYLLFAALFVADVVGAVAVLAG